MTAAKALILLLQASIFLTVFGLGLHATFQDAASLFRRPRLLLRSLVSKNVIMPFFAAVLAAVFGLLPTVKTALVLLAVSPVPPILPLQQLKLGGSSRYVMGLLVTTSLLAIILVPATIALLATIFHLDTGIQPAKVAKAVIATVLLPLGLGTLVHRQAPGFSARVASHVAKFALVILFLAAVPLLIVAWRSMAELIDNGTLLSIAIFVLVGAVVGHLLGGPDPANRTTLALATASRHPGLAITIAMASFPRQSRLIAAAVLLYVLAKIIVLIPYERWSKRRNPTPKPQTPGHEQKAA